MQPIHCTGTLKSGHLAGKPCRKFLGNLSTPYADVLCPRCGHKNTKNDEGSGPRDGPNSPQAQ